MSSSLRSTNAVNDLRIVSTAFSVGIPLAHEGFYSYVCHMPSSGLRVPQLLFSNDTMVKVFRANPGTNLEQAHEGLETVTALLLQYWHGSKSAAFVHKHITPVTSVDVHEISVRGTRSTKALVTPWYSQGDILTFIDRNSAVSKISLAVQVSKALEHMHKFDVVHGNIYPGNILVTDEGYATVTDISVYTAVTRALFDSHSDVIMHSSSIYQSPELLIAQAATFVERVKPMDVYSYALTMFTIFTGRAPFGGPSPQFGVVEDPMKMDRPTSELICDELWQLWQCCWARDPAARPSMAQVVDILENIELYH